jgi:hypothetical protein
MLRFDWSTDPKLVFFENGKLSVKTCFPELEEPFRLTEFLLQLEAEAEAK